MIEEWEKKANRKQEEYNPQNYCNRCGAYHYKYQLEEYGDELLCRNCLEIVLEEEKDENNI